MERWILSVELDGQWERCTFASRKEALETFAALRADYANALGSVTLTSLDAYIEAAEGKYIS